MAQSRQALTTHRLLHAFAGGPNDGANPLGELIVSGTTVYGMTFGGGPADSGMVYRVNTDGSSYSVLHNFMGGTADGASPHGALVLSGSSLYGVTEYGGARNYGTVFKVGTDGSDFQILHSFGVSYDGKWPHHGLAFDGSTLYGTTPFGGESPFQGTIFKIQPDGSGFATLHSFGSSDADGIFPNGAPIIVDSVLYGSSEAGGAHASGAVYRMNADGTEYRVLHAFAPDEAYNVWGPLAILGTTLYGVGHTGGASNLGSLFSIGTDGSAFRVQRSLSATDALYPGLGVAITDDQTAVLVTSSEGGEWGDGSIHVMSPDGSIFVPYHSFRAGVEGKPTQGRPVIVGTTLFGTTINGGANGAGSVYALDHERSYRVIESSAGQGIISCSPNADIRPGQTVRCSVQAGPYHRLTSLHDGNDDVTPRVQGGEYVIAGIDRDHSLMAFFSPVMGQSCTTRDECGNGNCIDGVCCDSWCGGGRTDDCLACNLPEAVGTCTPVHAGTVCRASGGACDAEEVCDGEHAECPTDRVLGPDTVCSAAACVSGRMTAAAACTGHAPTCPVVRLVSCGTYACGDDACKTECASEADCAPGLRCIEGACTMGAPETSRDLGVACKSDVECSSGHCTDGVCCDSACSGTCESCTLPGATGACTENTNEEQCRPETPTTPSKGTAVTPPQSLSVKCASTPGQPGSTGVMALLATAAIVMGARRRSGQRARGA